MPKKTVTTETKKTTEVYFQADEIEKMLRQKARMPKCEIEWETWSPMDGIAGARLKHVVEDKPDVVVYPSRKGKQSPSEE